MELGKVHGFAVWNINVIDLKQMDLQQEGGVCFVRFFKLSERTIVFSRTHLELSWLLPMQESQCIPRKWMELMMSCPGVPGGQGVWSRRPCLQAECWLPWPWGPWSPCLKYPCGPSTQQQHREGCYSRYVSLGQTMIGRWKYESLNIVHIFVSQCVTKALIVDCRQMPMVKFFCCCITWPH